MSENNAYFIKTKIVCNWDFIILKTVQNDTDLKTFVALRVKCYVKFKNEHFEVVRNFKISENMNVNIFKILETLGLPNRK
jgi:hypothetical protein